MSAWALFAAILGARLVGDLVVYLVTPTPPSAPPPARVVRTLRTRQRLEGDRGA